MDFSTTDMLIEIKINESELNPDRIEADSHFFSEIARVSEARYHRIVLNRELAGWVVNKCDLSWRHKKRIETIGQNFYKNHQLIDTSDDKKIPVLGVVYGDNELTKIGQLKWCIGHNIFIAKKFQERTRLLAEDRYDCDFYKVLFHTEAKRIEFGNIDIECFPGGGRSIDREFKEFAKNSIVICICDSDQLIPDDKYGETFIEVQNLSQTLNYIGQATCTPGHELENFIPIDIIHKVAGSVSKSATENLKKLIKKQGKVEKSDCLGLYYDTKNGVDQKKLYDACSNVDQTFWVDRKYGEFFKKYPNAKLPVYGSFIRKFLEKMVVDDEFDKEYADFLKSDYWKLHYSDWVLQILWFFCAEDRTIKLDNENSTFSNTSQPKKTNSLFVRCQDLLLSAYRRIRNLLPGP